MDTFNEVDVDKSQIQIRSELSTMSFEELQNLKERLGAKVYNEAVFGKDSRRCIVKKVFKRENKNRPREISSKKPVSLIKENNKVQENGPRDPRFDSLCGTFNSEAFKKSYNFIDDIKEKELKKLKKDLAHCSNLQQKNKLQYLIQRMENQNREKNRQIEKQNKKQREYEEQIKTLKEGKQTPFIAKSTKKVFDLVEQYESLKNNGKLGKHISKHRKRNSQREKKKNIF